MKDSKSILLTILLCVLICLSINAQKKNIADYFNEIPEKYLAIEESQRALILKSPGYEAASKNKVYFMLDTLDYRNGYMKISSIGDGAGENYEVTYFNLSDGDKLVAVNHFNWAMCCDDSHITFLKYNNGNWLDVSEKTILVDILAEFISNEDILKFIKEELDGQLIYKLPQKGKDIEVELSETFYYYIYEPPSEGYRFTTKEIEDAIKFNKMILKWNDGTFIAGEKSFKEL